MPKSVFIALYIVVAVEGDVYMKVILWDGEIELPNSLTLTERQEFVEDIVKRYPENFQYTSYDNVDRVVVVRLDILATYILKCCDNIWNDCISEHKGRKRRAKELSFADGDSYMRKVS